MPVYGSTAARPGGRERRGRRIRSPGSVNSVSHATSPGRKHAAVVVNPVKTDAHALRDSVERAAMSAGWEPSDWYETTTADAGAGVTAQALARGASVVITAGGDGTVRAVAGALRGTGVPLAVVPVGTGNLLARNLGLPLGSVDAAVALAFTGADRAVDVGVARTDAGDEHVYLVMAGMGIDAAMIANTNSVLKKRVGWLAYVDGGVRSLPKVRRLRLRFAVDGGPVRGARLSTILIANCGRLPGGIELFPDAEVDDGILDIAVLQPKTVFGWLFIWRRLVWENRVLRRTALGRSLLRFTGNDDGDDTRTIYYLRGREVEVTVREPQPFEIDGDAVGEAAALGFSVDAGALVVRVPHVLREGEKLRLAQAAPTPT